jgi:hypothetical protein
MPQAPSAAAATTIAIISMSFISHLWQYGQARLVISTCTDVLGLRFSECCFKFAQVNFAVSVTVHELQTNNCYKMG